MRQVERNYCTGRLRVVEASAPLAGLGQALVRTRALLISAGAERQIIDLANSSLAGRAIARPEFTRPALRKGQNERIVATAREMFAQLDAPVQRATLQLAGR